jgi:hypothetical protein
LYTVGLTKRFCFDSIPLIGKECCIVNVFSGLKSLLKCEFRFGTCDEMEAEFVEQARASMRGAGCAKIAAKGQKYFAENARCD